MPLKTPCTGRWDVAAGLGLASPAICEGASIPLRIEALDFTRRWHMALLFQAGGQSADSDPQAAYVEPGAGGVGILSCRLKRLIKRFLANFLDGLWHGSYDCRGVGNTWTNCVAAVASSWQCAGSACRFPPR